MRPVLRLRIRVTSPLSPCESRCLRRPLHATRRFDHDAGSRYQNIHPIQGFAADLLDAPLYSITPGTRSSPEPPPADELPKTEKEERIAKARVVFGSRLAGPGQRRQAIKDSSTEVAGVLVPPKPEEPDNCCMSGCVNCVWDQFRDEFEEWVAKNAEARIRMKEMGSPEANVAAGPKDQDMFADIPVGIREFMKTEKKLKERHRREAEAEAQAQAANGA